MRVDLYRCKGRDSKWLTIKLCQLYYLVYSACRWDILFCIFTKYEAVLMFLVTLLAEISFQGWKGEKVQHVWKIRTKSSYYQELDLVVEWIKHFGFCPILEFCACVCGLFKFQRYHMRLCLSLAPENTAARFVETKLIPAFDLKFWQKFVKG